MIITTESVDHVADRLRWLARATSSLAAGLLWAQPVLAGSFLDGSFDALALHRENATVAGLAMAATALACLALKIWGRGPWWALVSPALLFGAIGGQIAAGFARVIWLHVPLGVLLVGGSTALAVSLWLRPLTCAREGGLR